MTVSDSSGVAASPKRGKRANQALDIEAPVAALHQMTVDELRRRYAAVMGEPSRSRHKLHLIRRIAWLRPELRRAYSVGDTAVPGVASSPGC